MVGGVDTRRCWCGDTGPAFTPTDAADVRLGANVAATGAAAHGSSVVGGNGRAADVVVAEPAGAGPCAGALLVCAAWAGETEEAALFWPLIDALDALEGLLVCTAPNTGAGAHGSALSAPPPPPWLGVSQKLLLLLL